MADRRPGWRRREVVTRTNAIRREHGLRPLVPRRGLHLAARAHARDMAARGYFAHDTPAGVYHGHRVPPMSWASRIAHWFTRPGGENIAWGQSTPAEVITAWMNSPAHRENILRPGFRTIGVARTARRSTWVQDFGY